jgi:hypothetical protein
MQRRSHYIVLCALLIAFLPRTSSAASVEAVEKSIRAGVDHLYQVQAGDNWDNGWNQDNSNTGGRTALVVYSLLAAGESPQNPKLKAGIDFLLKQKPLGIYTLGIRCNVWFLLPQTPEVKEIFRAEATQLEKAMKVKGKARGLYNYTKDDGLRYDHSVSQYGVLGLWAAAQANLEINTNAWKNADEAWRRTQRKDGGWTYSDGEKEEVRASMTAAGVASLFITQEYTNGMAGINCTGNIKDENIERGLKWMSDNFKKVDNYYTWYGVERIGVASGLKYFGTVNWYQEGADRMVRQQNKEGSWGEVTDCAFAILFLVRGRAPVMMNKLEYVVDTAGDKPKPATWNQRPRDVANIARWTGRQIERDLNWQIVNLNVSVEEFHDAPILYISGKDSLQFTKEQEAKLKEFVEGGGLILGNADCASKPFAESFRKLGTKLFGWEFRELPEDHPIYTAEQYKRSVWKQKPSLLGLSNGARELMLLFPTADPAKGWQTQSFLGPDREPLSQLTTNLFLYAVDKQNLRYKGDTYLVKTKDKKSAAAKTIKIARLQYSGNWDPEPGGWRRLNALLQNEHQTRLDVQTIKVGEKKLFGYKIAHVTGTGRFVLNTLARDEIKKFVEGGGTLIVDAAGGNGEFATAAETELVAIFPGSKNTLKLLPISHPLYSSGNKIDEVEYRPFARRLLGNIHMPRLRGMEIGNRMAVIFSGEDLSVGLVGQPVDGIVGYVPNRIMVSETKPRMGASELMTNILLYASK